MKISSPLTLVATITALSIASNSHAAESSEAQENTWLHCGNLVDTAEGELLSERYIEITGNTITSVTSSRPSATNIVDLSSKTCLPGLMDMHVHLQ